MARRKRKPPITHTKQTETGVEVTTTWLSYVVPPEAPPERRRRHCPRCGWGPASTRKTSDGGDRYSDTPETYGFMCRRCCTDTGPTKWQEAK